MKENSKQIIALMKSLGGFAHTKDMLKEGIHTRDISRIVEEGDIIKCKRGLYMLSYIELPSSYIEISKIIPGGVFCLQSALAFHNLTTFEPPKYHLAIRQGSKIIVPEEYPVILHYFSPKQYETGFNEYPLEKFNIPVYDLEKTINDLIRYRNKMSPGIVKEALEEYMKRPDKDLVKLKVYSKILRTKRTLDQYMEVMM
jgi:predicted transcriptional regulator of viral defense system